MFEAKRSCWAGSRLSVTLTWRLAGNLLSTVLRGAVDSLSWAAWLSLGDLMVCSLVGWLAGAGLCNGNWLMNSGWLSRSVGIMKCVSKLRGISFLMAMGKRSFAGMDGWFFFSIVFDWSVTGIFTLFVVETCQSRLKHFICKKKNLKLVRVELGRIHLW